ncbi:hypothetical protein Cgig2_024765 [Carnegiea gigantea]|uniref:Uncharacterized protein n=1 Tax=Carnegiea gigantea TaxID=171969 RepID=A0A9Q1JYG9_9CARY|nr:hypothetical protein Cgig2_024765 [Carnegiea gigantea]
MDVLFKSIDGRDLLSAPETVDTSSPLSAPDLRLLIDRLDSHSQHIKSKEIKSTISDWESKKSQASVLRVIVRLSEKLSKVRELMQNGGLVKAVKIMIDLKRVLRIGDEEEREKEVIVYELLRRHWLLSFEEIQDLLLKFMENAVRFEHELSQIRVVYSSSVGGADVLEAMDVSVLGILDYGFARTADLFMKYAIGPAANLRAPISFVEESFGSFLENGEAILKIIP